MRSGAADTGIRHLPAAKVAFMVRAFSLSECGGHLTNEDAFVVEPHPGAPDCCICVIADGQGGQAGGAKAGQLACHVCHDLALRSPPGRLQSVGTWSGILHLADTAVADDPMAGYTTLVGFSVWQGFVCGASNGDSAAVLLHAGNRHLNLTEHQDKNPPIGSRVASIVPFAARLTRPWTLLAMTDGVWKYVGWDEMLKVADETPGENIVPLLLERARLQLSGRLQDDFTLIVLVDQD